MSQTTRQRLLIAVLAVVAVVSAYRFLGSGNARVGFGSDLRRSSRGRSARTTELTVAKLNLAALVREPVDFRPGRDPWGYAPKPKPEIVEPVRPQPVPVSRPEPKPVEPPKPSPDPLLPQPPSVDVTYLGSFGSVRHKIAVFEDEQGIYNKLAGQVLKEKFIVDQIGYESVDLRFVGFPDVPAERLPAGG